MSTIGVKYHNEDIHNIINKPMSPTVKSPRYKTKRKCLQNVMKERKKYNGHQTFGLVHYEAPESWNYLKKGKPRPQPPAVKFIDREEFKCTINRKNSPVPKHTVDNPKQSGKNFVKENIKKVAAIEPKVPCPRKVETPRGTVKDMAHLLQMIKIRQSEEYGKIPKYLCERKKRWAKEEEMRRREELAVKEFKEKMGIGTMGMAENVYMIDKETRQKLLDGLKENWNELSKQFLKLPVIIDTWPKIKRKMWLEKEIDQLEKDVRLVESHPYIYVERPVAKSYEEIVAEEIQKQQMERERQEKEAKEEKSQVKENQTPEKSEPQTEEMKEEEIKILD